MFASRHTAEFSLARITARASSGDILARLRLALIARAQRRSLARMDARSLADIGVSRAEAEAEANRPLWDVPATWLR